MRTGDRDALSGAIVETAHNIAARDIYRDGPVVTPPAAGGLQLGPGHPVQGRAVTGSRRAQASPREKTRASPSGWGA